MEISLVKVTFTMLKNIGTRMVKADLIERLNDIDLTFYFGNLSVEEFVIYIELIAEIDVF